MEIENPRKEGSTKGNASKILKFNEVTGYKVNIKKPIVFLYIIVVVDQSFSHVQIFVTPWTAARQASLVLHHLLEFAQTHVH